jgi:putative nucleotidyltransferase with HDIG domain
MINAKDIENLFHKQLDQIGDGDLRGKVVKAWVMACERGNWNSIEDLKKMPFTLLADTLGVNFIDHTIAVTEGAVALGRAQVEAYGKMPYKIDFDKLVAGGLLHDIGKLLEIESDGGGGFRKSLSGKYARHPISGALLAHEAGLSEDVINMIACHSKEGDGRPQVVETILIHQADFATFDPLVMKAKGLLIEA